jgi:hypothetical protein
MNPLIRLNTSTSITEVLTYDTTTGVIANKDIATLVQANETNTIVTGLQTAGHTIGTINNEDNVPFVIKESVSVLGTPTLAGNVLTIPFTNETGIVNNATVNLAQLALDVKVASVNYDPATQDIVITNSDGTSFTIDLTDLLQIIPTLTSNDDQANHLNGYNPLSQSQDFVLNFLAKGRTLSNFNNTAIAIVPNNNIAFQNEIRNIALDRDYNANLIDTFQTVNCNYIIKQGCTTIDLERVQVYLDLLLSQDQNEKTIFLNFINQTDQVIRLRAWGGENIQTNNTQGIQISPYKSITIYPSYDSGVTSGFIWYTTGEFEYTALNVTSSANQLTFSNAYQNQSVPIINTNGLNLIGNTLKSNINGVDSNTIVLPIQATTHTLSSAVNTLTSVTNAVSVTAPIINSNAITLTGNNFKITTNGIDSNTVALPTPVTTNVLSTNTASGIVSTVNNVASTLTPVLGQDTSYLGFDSAGVLVKTGRVIESNPVTTANVQLLVNPNYLTTTIVPYSGGKATVDYILPTSGNFVGQIFTMRNEDGSPAIVRTTNSTMTSPLTIPAGNVTPQVAVWHWNGLAWVYMPNTPFAGTITNVTDNANGTTTINAGAGQVQDVVKQGSELAVTPLNNISLDDNIIYTRTAGGLNVKVPRIEVITVPAGTAPLTFAVSNATEISLTYLTVANTPSLTTFPAGQFNGQILNVFNGNGGQATFSNTNTDSPANITLNNQNGYIAIWSSFKWVRISNETITLVKKARLVQPLTAGVNTITDNLGLLTPFARSVEVRDNATGALIATSVITELTNTFTMSVAVAVSSARITITG